MGAAQAKGRNAHPPSEPPHGTLTLRHVKKIKAKKHTVPSRYWALHNIGSRWPKRYVNFLHNDTGSRRRNLVR
jgi:hypothetical protein